MKLWYVCEALARQKLGLSDEFTLFAADMQYVKGERQSGNWVAAKVGIGKEIRPDPTKRGKWVDTHEKIIIYRNEIETYPGYEA